MTPDTTPAFIPDNGLTFKLETVLLIFKDNELAAIELQNGHIQRFTTKEATRADSLALFGADKAQNN